MLIFSESLNESSQISVQSEKSNMEPAPFNAQAHQSLLKFAIEIVQKLGKFVLQQARNFEAFSPEKKKIPSKDSATNQSQSELQSVEMADETIDLSFEEKFSKLLDSQLQDLEKEENEKAEALEISSYLADPDEEGVHEPWAIDGQGSALDRILPEEDLNSQTFNSNLKSNINLDSAFEVSKSHSKSSVKKSKKSKNDKHDVLIDTIGTLLQEVVKFGANQLKENAFKKKSQPQKPEKKASEAPVAPDQMQLLNLFSTIVSSQNQNILN